MTTVMGLDFSLTATGIGIVSLHAWGIETRTHTAESSGKRSDSIRLRGKRLRGLLEDIIAPFGMVDLVVAEGFIAVSAGGSSWDRAGLWWMVVNSYLQVGTPVAVAAPTVLKKWAANNGGADKATVAAAMTRLWPEVSPANDNEFDALALATMGAQRLGLDVPSRAHHAAALEKVEWPESLRARGYGEPLEEKA